MTYTYDALDRVSTALSQGSTNYPQWGLSWVYDRYGNRLQQNVTAGTAYGSQVVVSTTTNQITGTGYSYDANGNMTNDGVNTLIYDGENRAVSDADGSGTASYSYNGVGLRVQKVFSGTTTVYVFSGNKVLAEYANGTLNHEYVYLGTGLIAQYNSGTLNYLARDRLSTRLAMDLNGNILASQGHYPFGEDWYMTGPVTKRHFTSYERDAESGNDYATFRYDVNRFGRFLTADPVRPKGHSPQLLNRYSYVGSEPIGRKDPKGLYACVPVDDISGCLCNSPFGGGDIGGGDIGGGGGTGGGETGGFGGCAPGENGGCDSDLEEGDCSTEPAPPIPEPRPCDVTLNVEASREVDCSLTAKASTVNALVTGTDVGPRGYGGRVSNISVTTKSSASVFRVGPAAHSFNDFTQWHQRIQADNPGFLWWTISFNCDEQGDFDLGPFTTEVTCATE